METILKTFLEQNLFKPFCSFQFNVEMACFELEDVQLFSFFFSKALDLFRIVANLA